MQQQQTDLQQKQEHIAGALTSLTTILQDMRSETRKSTLGDVNNSRYISQPQTQSQRSSEPRSGIYEEVPDNSSSSRRYTVGLALGYDVPRRSEGEFISGRQYPYQVQNRDRKTSIQSQDGYYWEVQEDSSRYWRPTEGRPNSYEVPPRMEKEATYAPQQSYQFQDQEREVPVELENARASRQCQENSFRRTRNENRVYHSTVPEVKLLPFSRTEEWKVWFSRFEAVAERRRWDEDAKLDNLLPRLQGKAGDFVFSQLPQKALSNCEEFVREINSRFRVVETQKTFAAKFSQRNQRNNETVEEYEADLKRLYAKAYKSRDERTRQEDLVRRFLDGLKDHEARFEIEYHKEPDVIEDAVYHAVNFLQTKRRSTFESYTDRKFKKYVRTAS